MALTKTQINYLEDKLDRAVREKIQQYREDNKVVSGNTNSIVAKKIVDGSVKILSKAEIIECIKNNLKNECYYINSIGYTDLISKEDLDRIEKEQQQAQKKLNDYGNRLHKAKTNALDKFVLEGVDVETALAELDKIK